MYAFLSCYNTFSALTSLLVLHQEKIQTAKKIRVFKCRCGNQNALHMIQLAIILTCLSSLKSTMVYLSGTILSRLSWKKVIKQVLFSFYHAMKL